MTFRVHIFPDRVEYIQPAGGAIVRVVRTSAGQVTADIDFDGRINTESATRAAQGLLRLAGQEV